MNHDLSKWLKDDLGLSHMSESDLDCLKFHPRHGGLCRRFLAFLAESTLCNIKYTDVYAKEEYTAATKELETKNRDLILAVRELEDIAKKGENDMREVEFLKSRLSQLKALQQLMRHQSEALEVVANRPNLLIEQLDRNLDNPEYLDDTSLASMYELEENFVPDTIVTSRQMSPIEDQLKELVSQVDSINIKATSLAQSISSNMNNLEHDLKIPKVAVDDLQRLKIPPIEEVVEEDEEEKALIELNFELEKKVHEMDQQVSKLADQYKLRKAEIRAAKSRELEECLRLLNELTDDPHTSQNNAP